MAEIKYIGILKEECSEEKECCDKEQEDDKPSESLDEKVQAIFRRYSEEEIKKVDEALKRFFNL